MKRLRPLILIVLIGIGIRYYAMRPGPTELVLTGIVTTNDVIVSPQIAGRIDQLLFNEGDTVTRNQLIAVIQPGELQADQAYYAHNVEGLSSQVKQSQAALRFQERQTEDQIRQAEATLAAIVAQQAEATAALENARINMDRSQAMKMEGVAPIQQFDQARTAYDGAKAHLDAVNRQIDAQKATVALARSNAEQNEMKQGQVSMSEQERAAAAAQRTKADVRLSYSEVRAPIAGIVDTRAARSGEVVNEGQAIVTLIDPDDLWIRADVEETYIDRVRLGDKLNIRLPSGQVRQGTVFYRAADAGFATQRDVSRTKRDIKTFEIRLRVDNSDRRLAVGLTAYVLLPTQ